MPLPAQQEHSADSTRQPSCTTPRAPTTSPCSEGSERSNTSSSADHDLRPACKGEVRRMEADEVVVCREAADEMALT